MLALANMNLLYRRYRYDAFLASTCRLEMSAVEIWGGAPHFYVNEARHSDARRLGEKTRKSGLSIVCFTPEQCDYPVNLGASEPRDRKRSLNYFLRSLSLANSLEAPRMLVSAGYGQADVDQEKSWRYAREGLSLLAAAAEREGVSLLLEPFYAPYSNLVINADTTAQMLKQVASPYLLPMVDIACLAVQQEPLSAYFHHFGSGLRHMHFVDGQPGTSVHLPWGEGRFDATQLLTTIQQNDYRGYLTLELYGTALYLDPEQHVRQSLRWLEHASSRVKE